MILTFCRFIFFCFLFSSHNVLFENHSIMFSSKRNLFRINFIVFFVKIFSFNFFFCRFSFLFSLFIVALTFEALCRSMFFFVFEFYDFDRKHSNLMFFYVVVFSKRKFVTVFVYRERCFVLIFFYLLLIQKILFSMYLKKLSARSSM